MVLWHCLLHCFRGALTRGVQVTDQRVRDYYHSTVFDLESTNGGRPTGYIETNDNGDIRRRNYGPESEWESNDNSPNYSHSTRWSSHSTNGGRPTEYRETNNNGHIERTYNGRRVENWGPNDPFVRRNNPRFPSPSFMEDSDSSSFEDF